MSSGLWAIAHQESGNVTPREKTLTAETITVSYRLRIGAACAMRVELGVPAVDRIGNNARSINASYRLWAKANDVPRFRNGRSGGAIGGSPVRTFASAYAPPPRQRRR
jgi:hypothetical protein